MKGLLQVVAVAVSLMLAVVLSVVVFIAADQKPAVAACGAAGGPARVVVDDTELPQSVGPYSGASLVGAAAIIQAGADAGVSARGQTIGVMVSMGESSLTAVDHGDLAGPDSLGWFQQRDPWGSREKRLDAYSSATMFFTGGDGGQKGLLDIAGWESMTPTAAAHAVQRNQDPNHYTKYWDAAVAVMTALAGVQVDVVPGAGGQVCTDEQPGQLPVVGGAWVRPTTGRISSEFGMRWGSMHNGMDFAAPCGTPVYALTGGTVILVAKNNQPPATGYGTLVAIDHGGGVVSRYAHAANQDVLVAVGDTVQAGQQVTRVGTYGNSTGCHLHFEIQQGGRFTNPRPVLAEHGVQL